MPLQVHTMEVLDGSNNTHGDRVLIGILSGVAVVTGVNAVTPITFSQELPSPNYAVVVTPSQGLPFFVSGKTTTGFNVTGQGTVAAGTVDVMVFA